MQWWQTLRRVVAEHRRVPAAPDPPAPFLVRDRVLVAVATLSSLLEAALRTNLAWPLAALVAGLAMVWALPWRRVRPVASMAIAFGPTFVLSLVMVVARGEASGLYTGGVALVYVYALFRWGSGRDQQLGLVLAALAWAIGVSTTPTTPGEAVGGVVTLAVPALLGSLVRARLVARERRYDDVRAAERELLARELHDTVAHHVSAIVVQAQAGRAVAPTRPAAVVDVLASIEQAATEALGEMRVLVGALRDERPGADDVAPRRPQPGIGDLERLAAQPAGTLGVRLELDGDVHALPSGIAAAVYRIAQESITNAARHAAGASEVVVRVVATRDHVEVVVRDDGAHARRGWGEAGFGLRGMAERVALLGGRFDAGPSGRAPKAHGAGDAGRGEDGWVVRAEIPLRGMAVHR